MSQPNSARFRFYLFVFFLIFVAHRSSDGCFWGTAYAQQVPGLAFQGYVTAVYSPNGFDVNGTRVTISPETHFGLIGSNKAGDSGSLRDALRVGDFVKLTGPRNKSAKTMNADSVLLCDDWDKRIEGFGVIDKVISTGPVPVFQADGYRIRITSDTATAFGSGLKTLPDVGTNTWIKYEGKRDNSGVLVATQAKFVSARNGKIKPVSQQQAVPSQDSLIDANGNFLNIHTKVRYSDAGGPCGWHRLPANQALQARVRRVGMSVVPDYQKQLAADSPSKIFFRFYAVDEPKIRSDVVCAEGLILVPKQVTERLESDEQLAAIIADGVAYNMQWQSARLIAQWRELFGAELAASVAEAFVPEVYFANEIGGDIVAHELQVRMQEQRGRIALTLMADAGYNPWQAPEAWRLLASKRLSNDPDSLKYPDRSGYQLGILSLQYRNEPAAALQKTTVQASVSSVVE